MNIEGFIEFETLTGEIVSSGMSTNPLDTGDDDPTTTVILGEASKHQYIDITDGNTLLDKTPMLISVDKTTLSANGTDKVTISNIPIGASCTIGADSPFTIDDSVLEFTTNISQAYLMVFRKVEYITEEVIIVAI